MKLEQSYIDSCQNYSSLTDLLSKEASIFNENPELIASFLWATNLLAQKLILRLEELKAKNNKTNDERVEFYKIVLDLKTANKLYHLRFKDFLYEFLDKFAWTSKYKQFINTEAIRFFWDEENDLLIFISENGERKEVNIPLWTELISSFIFPRTTPFFYLFCLTTFSDGQIDQLRHAYLSYLSRNLIKSIK